jgi:predicted GH43/DUF377 family glycosyl hydrolase
VVASLFVPGEELTSGSSRASPVMQRVLALGEDGAEALLSETLERFVDRHDDLKATLRRHFEIVRDRLGASSGLSAAQQLLVGAYATSEVAVEAAALCNPSIVAHPDQGGLAPGELRFVLSLRAIGEGHISSIEFRTGVVGGGGTVRVDDPGRHLVDGRLEASEYRRGALRELLHDEVGHHEIAGRIFDALPPVFTESELDASLGELSRADLSRHETRLIVQALRTIASSNYALTFPSSSAIGERVIRPHGPSESNGMEDARFVRFVDDAGTVTYFATYTAFDGARVAPQLLITTDFESFRVAQLTGAAATNKGMAIFPRRIGGRFTALSRWDRESLSLATSLDAHHWVAGPSVHGPEKPWELIQVGNCGSPIETPAGWLVLTHGVGPMRTYSLGALLLDLDDPSRVLGSSTEPLLGPVGPEREGYVPNVVYTCGALVHDDTLVLPYAYGDRVTTFAAGSLAGILGTLR